MPHCFILKFKCENKDSSLFGGFWATFTTLSKDFTIHETCRHPVCLKPISEVL